MADIQREVGIGIKVECAALLYRDFCSRFAIIMNSGVTRPRRFQESFVIAGSSESRDSRTSSAINLLRMSFATCFGFGPMDIRCSVTS